MASILTVRQKTFISAISGSFISKNFYFSGGTALAEYYLRHRKSEDLDFFSENEFNTQDITVILKSLQPEIGYGSFDLQNSFNRNLYFLKYPDKYELKVEFDYYPFPQVEEPVRKDGLLVDSVLDIAVNKLFTISQQPRGRDYFDLYCIIQKYGYGLENLRILAKQKFDWHVDPLHLATQLDQVDSRLDDPIVQGEYDPEKISDFFLKEALKFKDQILSK